MGFLIKEVRTDSQTTEVEPKNMASSSIEKKLLGQDWRDLTQGFTLGGMDYVRSETYNEMC